MDSKYYHSNWAARDLGGISLPLLSDFHPKGVVAEKYGAYLDKAGITDRATVIIDKDGIVRHASSVGPGGLGKAEELLSLCREVDRLHGFAGQAPVLEPPRPEKLGLYFHHQCTFSRNVLSAIKNMRLKDKIEMLFSKM